jgi:hypothetical protein
VGEDGMGIIYPYELINMNPANHIQITETVLRIVPGITSDLEKENYLEDVGQKPLSLLSL